MKFYSEVLNKVFDTEADLTTAEQEYEAAVAAKKEAAATKKEEASKVEAAYQARNAAKRKYSADVVELRKQYNADLIALRTQFENNANNLKKDVDNAEKAYEDALKAFVDKYPEGYHMTLKDGDNVININTLQSADIRRLERLLADREKWFNEIFNEFFKA